MSSKFPKKWWHKTYQQIVGGGKLTHISYLEMSSVVVFLPQCLKLVGWGVKQSQVRVIWAWGKVECIVNLHIKWVSEEEEGEEKGLISYNEMFIQYACK
jgi:hypothetical protein